MKSSEKLPTWNLKDLYSSIQDPKIKQNLHACQKQAALFEKKYRGKLKVNASSVLKALKDYEAIQQEMVKPALYANLLFAESCTPKGRGAFLQYTRSEYVHINQHLMFFELEILKFSDKDLRKLVKDPTLKGYSHYLESLLNSKPHRLSEDAEKIFSDKNLTGSNAFIRLFDEELAGKKFIFGRGKKQLEVSETEVLSKLYSPHREERAEAAGSLTRGLKEESHRLTYIFNTLAEDKAIEDRYRNFPDPESSRHLANEIDRPMVDAMAEAVTSQYSLVQEFYGFKKKVLGFKELYDYDRYAPVDLKRESIPFSVARDMVLESFYGFSKEYGDIASKFFSKGWVDAAHREGKRGGAFCSFVTPDLHPYVFMNYTGSMREVFTLAHELGHAIHAYQMREQTVLNFDTPLTIAETASVFAEMLLFDHLRTTMKDKNALFALYIGKIESVFATVFRQISMYKFEQDVHGARQEKGELSTPEINALWRRRQVEMFGKSVTLTEGYDYWWSYIPHFVHTPFYVYAYAFGELLTLALYAQYKKEGKAFIPKYMDLLRTGGSKTPSELFKPLGINLHGKQFWKGGVGMIESMVKEVKTLQ